MVQKLRYWLLVATTKGRYSRGSSEIFLDQGLATIRKKRGISAMTENLRTQFGRLEVLPEDLSARNSRSAYFKTMFLIFKRAEARDWIDGLVISLNHSGREHKLQFHHIFLQTLLKKEYYQKEKINDISSLSFISGKANCEIRNTPPSKYLPEIINNQGEDALTKQSIPVSENLWLIENYDDFLQERRALITERMNNFTGINPFESGEV